MLTLEWQKLRDEQPQAKVNGKVVENHDLVLHKIQSIMGRGTGRPYQYEGERYFIYSTYRAMDRMKAELMTPEEAAERFNRNANDFIWE